MNPITAEDFLAEPDRQRVMDSIAEAEHRTSGEIRVHIEDHIEEGLLDHAAFIFESLGMHRTRDRNAVLIYVCVADRQVAILGDQGINDRVPSVFWHDAIGVLKLHFAAGRHADGLCEAVRMVGEKLKAYFPYAADDRNELSNEVTFG